MATLKEVIEELEALYIQHPDVNSVGYGEEKANDISKEGVQYQRAYLYLVDADDYRYNLKLTVTDEVLSDLSNRLDVQSGTLTTIKSLVQSMKHIDKVKFDGDITYTPTRLYGQDQSEGWFVEFEYLSDEEIICIEDLISNS